MMYYPSCPSFKTLFTTLDRGWRRSLCRDHGQRHDGTQKRRVLFMGNDIFALHNLKILHANFMDHSNSHISRLEVCCTDMKKLVQPVKKFAQESGLKVHAFPPNIQTGEFDLGVVASFGHLIPTNLINKFPRGILNVHASLLPRWRGASPIARAIMAGDAMTGVSIMEILPKHFDIGAVLAARQVSIGSDELRPDLEMRLALTGGQLMLEVIRDLETFVKNKAFQDEKLVTYAPKIYKSNFGIDWDQLSSREVYNLWRGISDLGKLFSHWQETQAIVRFQEIVHPNIIESLNISNSEDYSPGETLSVKSGSERFVCIKCKIGWTSFRKFYYDQKKVMTPLDFHNGFLSKDRRKKRFFKTYFDPSCQ